MLAPVLFNLLFDAVIAAMLSSYPHAGMKMLYNLKGPLVGDRRKLRKVDNVSDLEYADNMALLSDSMDELEKTLKMLNSVYVWTGLSINAKKTKVLAVRPVCIQSVPPRSVLLGEKEEHVEVVEELEYLGSTISHSGLVTIL